MRRVERLPYSLYGAGTGMLLNADQIKCNINLVRILILFDTADQVGIGLGVSVKITFLAAAQFLSEGALHLTVAHGPGHPPASLSHIIHKGGAVICLVPPAVLKHPTIKVRHKLSSCIS